MTTILMFLATFLPTFFLMEGVTWLTHRYVMHGFLWYLHKDHHQPSKGFFEKNDWFFVIFSVPSIACFYMGSLRQSAFLFGLGGGILFYGLAYFLVHEIVIHQRFKLFTRSSSRYVRVIRWAHKMHHKHLDKHPGESFGMLYVAKKYWEKVRKDDEVKRQSATSR